MANASERTYTVIGTTIKDGVCKVRWGNDLISRLKVLNSSGSTDIKLYETPEPMTKLASLKWLIANKDLTEAEQDIVHLKKAEKSRLQQKQTIAVSAHQPVTTPIKEQ